MIFKKKKIYCLIGASGSGKSRIAKELIESGMSEIISHTTRKPREGEVHGYDYYFVSNEEFDTIDKAEFANYGGNRYCISKTELENKFKNNDNIVVVVEMNGYKQLKENCSDLADIISIYIKTDLETMKKRMLIRNDKAEDIQKRLDNAIKTNEFDNEHLADYVVDNRGDFETTMAQIKEILSKFI